MGGRGGLGQMAHKIETFPPVTMGRARRESRAISAGQKWKSECAKDPAARPPWD
jgi:hypothetical protein